MSSLTGIQTNWFAIYIDRDRTEKVALHFLHSSLLEVRMEFNSKRTTQMRLKSLSVLIQVSNHSSQSQNIIVNCNNI